MTKPVCLAALLLPALAVPAAAQEGLILPERLELAARDHGGIDFSIGLVGRVAGIGGELDANAEADYSDVFGSGSGLAIEAALLFDPGFGWAVGPYLSAGWDEFSGGSDTDDLGQTLRADDWEMTTVLFGAKGVFPFSPYWHVEAHAALGVVFSDSVKGEFTDVTVTTFDVEVFDETTVLAFDMGARIGFRVEYFFAEFGLGIRLQGAPEDSDLDFESDGPAMLALEMSLGLRF